MAGTPRTNTPTEQNKEDNTLLLYRLKLVEDAVKEVGEKVDKQDNIKKIDLIEFRNDIGQRIIDAIGGLQKQVDTIEKSKADQSDIEMINSKLKDINGLIKAIAGVFTAIIAGLVVFYVTHGGAN